MDTPEGGEIPPLDFGDEELFTIRKPAVRADDHPTSARASARVEAAQGTIRFHVHRFAKEAGPDGFIDADLIAAFPGAPESSYRKRRTELTADGLIVDSGRTRKNDKGNDEIVWVHREYAPHLVPPRGTMTSEEWAALLADLHGQAGEVSAWATQMLAEGRAALGGRLAGLAHRLRQLR